MNSDPLLSVVVVSRNDDHGGNLNHRMQLFVSGFLEQARRFNLSSELIIVEWNPPEDRPRLAEALEWPEDTGPCAVRIIEVPPEIHSRFKYSDGLPLFQMIGKNVGIRRARGRFVLATNIDILFSDELMAYFASERLVSGHMYRIDRYDVPFEIPPDATIEEKLEYCHEHIIRINKQGGTLIPGQTSLSAVQSIKKRFGEIKNIRDIGNLIKDGCRIYILRPVYRLYTKIVLQTLFGKPLHTNACGDFTLMAYEHWLDVRGYPEYEMYSLFIDGLLCYAAHYDNARELILEDPMRIYHIEHAPGSGWAPGVGGKLLNDRLKKAGIPSLPYKEYTSMIRRMGWKRRPLIVNGEDWGLGAETLRDEVIVKAGPDKS